jgi:RHS repeat-associated protein
VWSDGVATMVPGISEKNGGVTSTILSDRLGSMKGMTNAGAVTDTAEFDAFGKIVARTGTNATQKGFAGGYGYQEDGETGYKLLGHRYYDPETGRFLSRDPSFDGNNWYSYCGNNPLVETDAEGLSANELEGPIKRGENSGKLPKGTGDKYKKDKDFKNRLHEKLKKLKEKRARENKGKPDKKGRTRNPNLSDEDIWDLTRNLLPGPAPAYVPDLESGSRHPAPGYALPRGGTDRGRFGPQDRWWEEKDVDDFLRRNIIVPGPAGGARALFPLLRRLLFGT